MRFEEAIIRVRILRDLYQPGLSALRAQDKPRLSFENTRYISGSINLDDALSQELPNSPRWDYGIGMKIDLINDEVIWVEVHFAKASEVQVIINKVQWLKEWLRENALDLMKITRNNSSYIWISSSGVYFQKNSPQAKKLAIAGVSFPREHYHVD